MAGIELLHLPAVESEWNVTTFFHKFRVHQFLRHPRELGCSQMNMMKLTSLIVKSFIYFQYLPQFST